MKPNAVPSISGLPKTKAVETYYIQEHVQKIDDMDPNLRSNLEDVINQILKQYRDWVYTQINGISYLYKLAFDPLRIESALTFNEDQIILQFDGVEISKEFVEKTLGKIFPLSIETLPELVKFFEFLNPEEFRIQR